MTVATIDQASAPTRAIPASGTSRRPGMRRAGGYLVRILLVGFFAFPLVFMFMSSLKPDDQIFADLDSIRAFLPVGDISLSNYTGVFDTVPAARFLANSIAISWPTPFPSICSTPISRASPRPWTRRRGSTVPAGSASTAVSSCRWPARRSRPWPS
jgi:multiple sugar transport system permease protein